MNPLYFSLQPMYAEFLKYVLRGAECECCTLS